jgi:hypothetical protein
MTATTETAVPAAAAPPPRTRYHFVLAYEVTNARGDASQKGCASGTAEVAPGDTRGALFARCLDWVRKTRAADPDVLQGPPTVLFFSLERDEL